jgi:hypothetical protein
MENSVLAGHCILADVRSGTIDHEKLAIFGMYSAYLAGLAARRLEQPEQDVVGKRGVARQRQMIRE